MIFTNTLFRRFRKSTVPGALLMVLLQRTPVLRVAVVAEEMVIASPVGTVLKSVLSAVAALGAVNSVAGATPLQTTGGGTASGVTIQAGQNASIFFSVPGTQTPIMSWTVSGNFPAGMNFSGLTSAGNVNVQTLMLGGAPTTAGTYNLTIQCFDGTNGSGFESAMYPYTVTVQGSTATAPSITNHPQSQTVTAGTGVSFTASASGSPAPALQWQKNNQNIPGATSGTYSIANTVIGDSGNYTLVATNSAGTATSNAAVLTVNAPTSAPAFTVHPGSMTVTAGTQVTFTAAATGNPTPTFQWQKNNVNIGGATGTSYTIASPVVGDSGTYTVVATNSVGSVASNPATLTVNAATSAPAFTTHPQSQTVTAGTLVTFTAAASGNPTPTYQWQKNTVNIAGATNSSYAIASVAPADAGSYTVVATNSIGSLASNAATLTVNVTPLITLQPVNQTVNAGTMVTFTAAASGTPAPTYQWRKNGVNIAGATGSTYTIASPGGTDAGSYTFVASNAAGSATSNGATLTVNTAPVIATQPISQSVGVSFPVTLTVTASGTPAPTYQWRKNGVNIAGAVGASYGIDSVTLGDGGTYSVVVTNSVGAVPSNGAVLTAVPFNPATAKASDFNGDGKPDILWESSVGGEHGLWLMDGIGITSWIDLYTVTPPWHIAGIADFNGDGKPDILWESSVGGEHGLWLMNGTSITAWVDLYTVAPPWHVAGVADFNGDGKPDILWENSAGGEHGLWLMNGINITTWVDLYTVAPPWHVASVADFNGDGKPDILWENSAGGEHGLWLMDGINITAWVDLYTVAPPWHVASVADFNGDGKPDILWENSAGGEHGLWLMNGINITAWVDLYTVSPPWHVAR